MAKDYSSHIRTTHPLRKEGTQLKVANAIYHFRANVLGHYVAEVPDPAHRAAILSISAGYKPYRPTPSEVDQLTRADAGTPGIDTGTLAPAAQAKDEAGAAAGKAAAAHITPPASERRNNRAQHANAA